MTQILSNLTTGSIFGLLRERHDCSCKLRVFKPDAVNHSKTGILLRPCPSSGNVQVRNRQGETMFLCPSSRTPQRSHHRRCVGPSPDDPAAFPISSHDPASPLPVYRCRDTSALCSAVAHDCAIADQPSNNWFLSWRFQKISCGRSSWVSLLQRGGCVLLAALCLDRSRM
jgi:hypothetical protein